MRSFCVIFLAFLAGCKDHAAMTGYVDAHYLYLSSANGGYIDDLKVEEGDWVAPQHFLAHLESIAEDGALSHATSGAHIQEALLSKARSGERQTVVEMGEEHRKVLESQYDYSKKYLDKMQKLFDKKAITLDVLERATKDYLAAKAAFQHAKLDALLKTLPKEDQYLRVHEEQLRQAESDVSVQRWYRSHQNLVSPTAGWVTHIFYRPGEYVPQGRPVIEFLAPEYEYVVFFVGTKQLSQMKLGQLIEVATDTYRAKVKVSYIAKQAEYTPPVIYSEKQQARLVFQVKAQVSSEDAEHLHPGQPVQVYLS
jgi:HlyD family secretion protein